jgi:hypothetical protein
VWRLQLDAGYTSRSIVNLEARGGSVGIGLGFTPTPHVEIGFPLRLFFGRTTRGLAFASSALSNTVGFVLGRLRLELGPSLAVVGVRRAVRPAWIVRTFLGGTAAARLDVLRTPSASTFLFAGVDGIVYGNSGGWGWTLGAGAAFNLGSTPEQR